jgi:hypothetical protein
MVIRVLDRVELPETDIDHVGIGAPDLPRAVPVIAIVPGGQARRPAVGIGEPSPHYNPVQCLPLVKFVPLLRTRLAMAASLRTNPYDVSAKSRQRAGALSGARARHCRRRVMMMMNDHHRRRVILSGDASRLPGGGEDQHSDHEQLSAQGPSLSLSVSLSVSLCLSGQSSPVSTAPHLCSGNKGNFLG